MRYRTNLKLILIVAAAIVVCFVSASFAAKRTPAVKPVPKPKAEANEPNAVSFPYVAEIIEDNVNIRSGAGTNFYACGRLSKGDKVEVVGTQFSWSQIVPTPSCFAWVSKQYLSVEPNDPNTGIVSADSVRVYAGSAESPKPIRSTTVLVKLNRGDKVALIGPPEEDYYKIAPPTGSFLWISANYTKLIGPVAAVGHPAPAVVPTTMSVEAKKLEEYYALEKQLKAEKEKPLEEQNYDALKKAFVEIAGNKEAGKAARYSEFAIKQIEQCELAIQVGKESQLQDTQFQKVQQLIENAREAKLAQVQDFSKFAAIGQFQPSNIFGAAQQIKRYRLVDSAGKTICYAEPTGPATGIDLEGFVGKQVGLVGTIEPLPQISGVMISFTEIAEMK